MSPTLLADLYRAHQTWDESVKVDGYWDYRGACTCGWRGEAGTGIASEQACEQHFAEVFAADPPVDVDPHIEPHRTVRTVALPGPCVLRREVGVTGRHGRLVIDDGIDEEQLVCWVDDDERSCIVVDEVMAVVRHVAAHVASGARPNPLDCEYR